ncbi:hypothetical protein JCM3766R1_000518 [Sporobolomyces carnicolor]
MDLDSPTSSTSLSPNTRPRLSSNRKITACDPCRRSKQKCDHVHPCSTCVKKQATDRYVWTESDSRRSAALAQQRDKNENDDLRSEIDRLQKLVNVLVDARLDLVSSPPPASQKSRTSVPLVPDRASRESSSSDGDIAERLFHLTISSFSTTTSKTENVTPRIRLIHEAEQLLESLPKQSNSIAPSSTAFPFLRQSAPSLGEIMARLPSANEVILSETYFWTCASWFFHPIPRYLYDQHKRSVFEARDSNRLVDPVALSILLAVIGIGSNCRYTYTPAGGSQAELRAARGWIELATAALTHSNFIEDPTPDTIRALSLLAIFHLSIGPGDEGNLGFALTGLAVQASLQIKLHRDPSQLDVSFSFREAEERRSLIHHVYLLDGIATASYSRGYILLHARDISASFPLDLHDHELAVAEGAPERPFEETVLTSLIERFKISRYSEGVTEEILSGKPLAYERVLELDRELESLLESIHPLYQWGHLPLLDLSVASSELRAWRISIVWITLWREKLRLHRPFLHRSYSDPSLAYSRQACIDAAKGFLAIHACPANLVPAAGFTHKACLACIILALEIVYDKDHCHSRQYRGLIEGALTRLGKFAKISIIARRGVKIIRFLLEQAGGDGPEAPPAKRTRSLPSPRGTPVIVVGGPGDRSALDPGDEDLNSGHSSKVVSESRALADPVDAADFLADLGDAFPPSPPFPTAADPVGTSFDFGLSPPSSSSATGSLSPFAVKNGSLSLFESAPVAAVRDATSLDTLETSLLFRQDTAAIDFETLFGDGDSSVEQTGDFLLVD